MNVKRNLKFRIYPRAGKLKKLEQTLEGCRLIYNKILETRKNAWEQEKRSVSMYDCNKMLPAWNPERKIYSRVLEEVSIRVDLAFQGFFRRVKQGQTPGHPRFKAQGRYSSFTYTQSGWKLVSDKKLYLSKIGDVKINLHRPVEGKIKTCTVVREGSKWFVVFCYETEKKLPTMTSVNEIGIDVGCSSFATFNDGSTIEHPYYYRKSQEKLKVFQSKYFKNKTVNNKRKLQKVHTKIKNQRQDFLHKLTRKLVSENKTICVEKLDIKSMVQDSPKTGLNKSIMDSGWCYFRQMLKYKAEEAGALLVEVDPKNTSAACSGCGNVVKKELSERQHDCKVCGLKLGRDHNAAINILRVGLDTLTKLKSKAKTSAVNG